MLQLNFDATNVAPSAPAAAIETGWYPTNIIMTEMKPTKAQDGFYLEIKFRISSGVNAGRTLTSRLNLQNKSQQAVDIAYGELSAICHAVGKLRVGVAAELHGGALEIYVKKVPRNDAPGEFSNDIAGYRAVGANGNQPGFAGAVGTQVAAAPAWAAPAAPVPPPQAFVQAGQAQAPAWGSPAAVQPAQNFAPQPATQPAAAAPAAAGSVPPWAR